MNETEIDKITNINRYNEGREVYQNLVKNGREFLSELKSQRYNGILDGKKITDDWFPSPFFLVDKQGSIDNTFSSNTYRISPPDVFISHSHQDEQKILRLVDYLYDKYGIKSFVDSIFWDYCDDLLRMLDNKYNKEYNPHDGYFYYYTGRNITTSHVHMMLAEALTNVIDNTECFLFIKSSNSVPTILDAIENTRSPWIYHEINTVKSMRSRIPYRYALQSNVLLNESYNNNRLNFLQVDYQIDTDEYTEITADDFNRLLEISKSRMPNIPNPEFYLDELYKGKRINLRTCSDEFYKYVPRDMLEDEPFEKNHPETLNEQAVMEDGSTLEVCENLRPYFEATIRLNNDEAIRKLTNCICKSKRINYRSSDEEECKQIIECLAYFNSEELFKTCDLEDHPKLYQNDIVNKKLIKHGLAYLSDNNASLQLTPLGRKFFDIVRPYNILLLGV